MTSANKPTQEVVVRELNQTGTYITLGHRLLRVEPGDQARGFAQFVFSWDSTLEAGRQHYFARALLVDARTLCENLHPLKRQALRITKETFVPNDKTK